jgi:hypothetical protein
MYLDAYSIKNLSYLLVSVMSSPNFSTDEQLIQNIKDRITAIYNESDPDLDNGTRERLAITMGPGLEPESTVQILKDIEHNSNIVELIESDLLKDGCYTKNQVVCDGRLKAQFVVDDKFVVEIDENSAIHRKTPSGLKLLSRGRLANELAIKAGYSGGYIGISLLEMEYEKNEAEYLLKVLNPVFQK